MNNCDIRSLLDIPEWEAMQDQLATLTRTAIITIDYKGIPVSKHSGRTDFCTVIRENAVSRKRCHKCDALAGLEAVRINKPFIYLCHCGIVDVAVPVVVGDRYLGAVMFGQVRIPNNDTDTKVERLVSEISSFNGDGPSGRTDLMEMYNRLPEMEYKRIAQIADLIDSIVHYVVNRHMKTLADELSYKYKLKNSLPPSFDGGGLDSELSLKELERLSAPPSSTYDLVSELVLVNSRVFPALKYVHEHTRDNISMQAMADLCNLSAGYFSRLFTRDVGETFTDFLNREKIQLACTLLENTDSSVTQIAAELSFQDASYFVKVFKRHQGITPSEYRKSTK